MKKVNIYTDGACSGNPGAGGYCAILIYNGIEKVVSGSENFTTNNRMELLAVIKGLEALKQACEVSIFSDSRYVVDAFNEEWIANWQSNSWRNSNNKAVKNIDLWQKLIAFTKIHKVSFVKVKGHSDNEYNNRCDKIAVEEYKKLSSSN